MSKLPFLTTALLTCVFATGLRPAYAKLPALSPEAQAKADETKAKTAHGDKVSAYKLCLAMDRSVAHYFKTSGQDAKPPAATAPCTDPGPFVYPPPDAAAPVAAAVQPGPVKK